MGERQGKAKIALKGVLITRKDGSVRCPYDVVVGTWEETDAILKLWAKASCGNAGYETCDFRVVFEDGNSYAGTHYLRQQDCFLRNILATHIHRICDETRIGWDADAFLARYDIPRAA